MDKKSILCLNMLFIIGLIGCSTNLNDAILNNDLNAIQSVAKKGKLKINEKDKYGRTLLHKAASYGKIEIVQILVSEGADINAQDSYNETPVTLAIYSGHENVLTYLLDKGANINFKNSAGDSPLHRAAYSGYLNAVKILVSNKADVNANNNKGETPLHLAGYSNNLELVKYLVSNGAKINAVDKMGNTPLISAVYTAQLEVVKYLLAQGADRNIENNDGVSALNIAKDNRYSEIADVLSYSVQVSSKSQDDLVVQKKPAKKISLLDKTPPKIIITSHDVSRSIIPIRNEKKAKIEGKATDKSGIVEITVNNKDVLFDKTGNFGVDVFLTLGENEIVVGAMDRYGNRARKTFTIVRENPKKQTKIEIPKATQKKYHALIIGNNNYQYLKKLQTAVEDAQAIGNVLKFQYGFETMLLLDVTRYDIIRAINIYRRKLKEDDSLLIYYAGHGVFDQTAAKAYWLPVDARSDEDTNWIIVDTVTSNIKRISSRHILVVADSCYSGTFTRKSRTQLDSAYQRERYLGKMTAKKSRTLLASGGNEPVSDMGGEGHSVFAKAFISGLKNLEQSEFTAEELYYQFIREMVAGSSEQTPEYNIIRNSGHEGGDFVFRRIND